MEKNYAKKIYKICFPKCSKYDGAIRVYSCRHFFYIGQLRSKWTGSPQPDPAGFWNHVRDRIDDRDRFCDEIRDPQSQRRRGGSLFYTVDQLGGTFQHSIYADRDFLPG